MIYQPIGKKLKQKYITFKQQTNEKTNRNVSNYRIRS